MPSYWMNGTNIDYMTYALTLELPEKIFVQLLQAAKSASQSPEEWLVENLDKQLNADGVDLRRHFGAVNLGHPTGVNTSSIDADLAHASRGSAR